MWTTFAGTIVYKVILNKDITLEQFTFVYSRPYAYLKSQFDNYKIGKPISTIEVPELKENHDAILNAFQTKLPDILN